jgi:hypothetical protein
MLQSDSTSRLINPELGEHHAHRMYSILQAYRWRDLKPNTELPSDINARLTAAHLSHTNIMRRDMRP